MIECISPTFLSLNACAETLVGDGAAISQNEATAEGMADAAGQTAALKTSKNNWYLAHDYDGLPYNRFHIEVQNHIVGRNDINISKELYLKYAERNKVTNSYEGSADLYQINKDIDGTYVYVWEVKPHSYSEEPNRTKGINQLQSYIDTPKEQVGNKALGLDVDNLTFKRGETDGITFTGGETSFYITTETEVAFEHIRYDVEYTNQGNGLIIYDFTRVLERKENKEPSEDKAGEKPEEDSVPGADSPTNEPPISDDEGDSYNSDPDANTPPESDEYDNEHPLWPFGLHWITKFIDYLINSGSSNNNSGSGGGNSSSNSGSGGSNSGSGGRDIQMTPKKPAVAITPYGEAYYAMGEYSITQLPSNSVISSSGFSFDNNGNVISGETVCITVGSIAFLVALAGAGKVKHTETIEETSHSGTIVVLCDNFLFEANEALRTGDAQRMATACKDFSIYTGSIGVSAKDISSFLSNGLDSLSGSLLGLISGNLNDFLKSLTTPPPHDPLIIDFGNSGIELYSIANGVNFDLDNNGFAEKTAWIGTEDGFLALDRNNNGTIDNGGELFGDNVALKNGAISQNGFEALADLDSNSDGIIDSMDSSFSKLLVWFDINRNGKSETDELKALSDVNVKSISLTYKKSNIRDSETGMRITASADVVIDEGGVEVNTKVSEFWFPADFSDTTRNGEITAGNVPIINEALENDISGKLSSLVEEFCNSTDYIRKRYLNKQILYILTDSCDIPSNSRGGNIDARDLHIVEQFMGQDFVGVNGANPNVKAAEILKNIVTDIKGRSIKKFYRMYERLCRKTYAAFLFLS